MSGSLTVRSPEDDSEARWNWQPSEDGALCERQGAWRLEADAAALGALTGTTAEAWRAKGSAGRVKLLREVRGGGRGRGVTGHWTKLLRSFPPLAQAGPFEGATF